VTESRAALATFNATSYVLALVIGLTPADIDFVTDGLWLVPIAVGGTLLGTWSAHRVRTRTFRSALLATVWLAGLVALTAVLVR
jgi:uncharacterized membrane protein YfcA